MLPLTSVQTYVLYIYISCFISKITFSNSWSVTKIFGHKYFTIIILTIWGHVTFKWQQGSVVVELDWPHSIACPPKPPTRCKDLGDIFFTESEL